MKKLVFEIYVGSNMVSGQGKDIVAVVMLPPELPKQHYKIDGTDNNECGIGFKYLWHLANYMNDWLELVENQDYIKAEIYLNKLSVRKVFKGKTIVKILDKISNIKPLSQINDFKDIGESE